MRGPDACSAVCFAPCLPSAVAAFSLDRGSIINIVQQQVTADACPHLHVMSHWSG